MIDLTQEYHMCLKGVSSVPFILKFKHQIFFIVQVNQEDFGDMKHVTNCTPAFLAKVVKKSSVVQKLLD